MNKQLSRGHLFKDGNERLKKNIKLVDVELSGALLRQNNIILNLKRSCDRCDKSFTKTGGFYKYQKNCKVMSDVPKTNNR